jgi:hypothetical protein
MRASTRGRGSPIRTSWCARRARGRRSRPDRTSCRCGLRAAITMVLPKASSLQIETFGAFAS